MNNSVMVVYSKLTKEQQGYLDYANGAKMTALVKYDDNKFIGVNIVESATLSILHKEGHWCLGELKNNEEGTKETT